MQQQIESDTTKYLNVCTYLKSRIIGTYHVNRLPKNLIKIHIVVVFHVNPDSPLAQIKKEPDGCALTQCIHHDPHHQTL